MKIICIVGDGRSGSTLLESILNNEERTISIGECYRFWERFYKNETYCGCYQQIGECDLWRQIDAELRLKMAKYDPVVIKGLIREACLFRNFNALKQGERFDVLISIAREFYISIGKVSGKNVIIDSSKSPSWAKILCLIPEFDVSIIHLERSLPHVASSWKKKVILPEFIDKHVLMPVKSDMTIMRSWFKVKLLSSRLRKYNYLYVNYENLTNHPIRVINQVVNFLNIGLVPTGPFYHKANHAIAGNPMRRSHDTEITILPHHKHKPENLSLLEYYAFSFLNKMSNLLRF